MGRLQLEYPSTQYTQRAITDSTPSASPFLRPLAAIDPQTSDPGLADGKAGAAAIIQIQDDEIGPPPSLQAAALTLAHQRGHILRHTAHRLRQGAMRHGDHVAHALIQCAAGAYQGLSFRLPSLPTTLLLIFLYLLPHQSHPPAHLPLPAPDLPVPGIDPVRQTGQLDTIGDQDAVGGVGAQRHAQHAGVQVHAVGDDGVVGPVRRRLVAHEPGQARLAVVEGWHGVEDVRQCSGAGVQGGEAGVVGCGGVAERDGYARVGLLEVCYQGEGAGEFGREGDQFENRGGVGEVVDAFWAGAGAGAGAAGVEVDKVAGVVGAFFRGVQVWAFGVGAEEGGPVWEAARCEEGEDLGW